MFLLKQIFFVKNPRMVLKLTRNIKCQYLHVAILGSGMLLAINVTEVYSGLNWQHVGVNHVTILLH